MAFPAFCILAVERGQEINRGARMEPCSVGREQGEGRQGPGRPDEDLKKVWVWSNQIFFQVHNCSFGTILHTEHFEMPSFPCSEVCIELIFRLCMQCLVSS